MAASEEEQGCRRWTMSAMVYRRVGARQAGEGSNEKNRNELLSPLVAVTDGIASVRVKVKGIHRESPWCAPGPC